MKSLGFKKLNLPRAVVVVKWSACSPSTPTIHVCFPPKRLQFFLKILCLKRANINIKEAGVGPFKKTCQALFLTKDCIKVFWPSSDQKSSA